MHLKELKQMSPADLILFAEEKGVENASNRRKQDLMFSILKNLADNGDTINGDGVIEILPDGFGFLRAPESIICLGLMTYMFLRRKLENLD